MPVPRPSSIPRHSGGENQNKGKQKKSRKKNDGPHGLGPFIRLFSQSRNLISSLMSCEAVEIRRLHSAVAGTAGPIIFRRLMRSVATRRDARRNPAKATIDKADGRGDAAPRYQPLTTPSTLSMGTTTSSCGRRWLSDAGDAGR